MRLQIHLLSSFLLLTIFNLNLVAQDVGAKQELPIIEITGIADKEVEPDEIFIKVVLKDYFKGKTKITIEEQETKMINGLKTKGIDQENIKLSDTEAGFIKIKILKKDVIATKDYVIKVSNAQEVKKVFEVLDNINIKTAYIQKVGHSKMKAFKKELRIAAIKDAKEKGEYLLEAIGYTLGKPLKINNSYSGHQPNIRGSRANATNYYIDGIKVTGDYDKKKNRSESQNDIQYQKIKLESTIIVKFLIE